jgi:hypothetical protein
MAFLLKWQRDQQARAERAAQQRIYHWIGRELLPAEKLLASADVIRGRPFPWMTLLFAPWIAFLAVSHGKLVLAAWFSLVPLGFILGHIWPRYFLAVTSQRVLFVRARHLRLRKKLDHTIVFPRHTVSVLEKQVRLFAAVRMTLNLSSPTREKAWRISFLTSDSSSRARAVALAISEPDPPPTKPGLEGFPA